MRMRSFVIGLLTAVALLAAAASGYWVWWAGQLERAIAQWRELQRLRGYEITFDGPAIAGFPLAHAARFEAPTVRAPDGASWHGPTLSARADLWDPRTIAVTFSGRHLLEHLKAGPLEAATLVGRDATGAVRLLGDGRLERAEATVEGLEVLAQPLGRVLSDRMRLSLTPRYDAKTGSLLGQAFTVELDDLRLPARLAAPLEPTAEKLALAGRLEGLPPPHSPLEADPRRALAYWRDSGGALELENVVVAWPPLDLTATGRLTLDEMLRPQGQLAARITGLPEVLDRLEAAGLMSARDAANIKLGVLAFSRDGDADGRPELNAPLIFRAGVLSLGPFPLARISPVL